MVKKMVKVKICGITNLEDALYAVGQGADALGFIFYKKSPRYISPNKAKIIIKQLPNFVKKAGVFVNAREATVIRIAQDLKLDMLQFHGDESNDFCLRFRDFKVIKAFRIKKGIKLADLFKYDVWAYLLDSFIKGKFGGTGKSFNWQLLSCLRGSRRPLFLSGGLGPDNVKKALSKFPGDWVDASSSLEKYPGKKDLNKIKRFIKNAKV
ncbi:MAG: phosphoribosylanthranilate isomerase [Candidatus Omnitrophota bacterium]